jgi:uncharacterized protein (TIGR01777 family)
VLALPESERPTVLVSQSATGYYGPCDERELEETAPAGEDFLAGVTSAWEAEAQAAATALRVVVTRTGVVGARAEGGRARVLGVERVGLGGAGGSGRQYVPWIHLDDVVDGLLFCLDTAEATGPVNLTAPNPVDNAEFSQALGHALHRPVLLRVPAFALRARYGEMATLLITGQRVLPRRLLELGYGFRHPTIGRALQELLGS